MPCPPGWLSSPTLLLALIVALVVGPTIPAHAYVTAESPAFYADMLDRHDGVFVSEELAGHLDRREIADDLRARVREEEVSLDVLVVAHPTYDSLDWLADQVALHSGRALVVFSPHTNHVKASALASAGLPPQVAEYTSYTGAYPEDPRDQLDRLLRAATYRNLDQRTARAKTEYIQRVEGETDPDAAGPALFSQRWLTVTWPSTAGLVITAVCTAVLVGGGVTAIRRRREVAS